MGPVLSQGAQTFVPGEVTLGTTVLQIPDGGGSNMLWFPSPEMTLGPSMP